MFITPKELPCIPASLPVYRTIRPEWTPERAARLAARFGVDAPAKAVEPWYVCRTDEAVVEIFQATHSARLTRATFNVEATTSDSSEMPSDEAAVKRADTFIEELRDIHKSQPLRPTLSHIEAITQENGRPRNSPRTVAVQVNYRFTLEDLPLRGPGAKAQATIGASGTIEQAYLFWRQAEQTGAQWATRPAAAALDALATSKNFATVIRDKHVEVLQIQAGWLCLPPTISQDTLFPVYEIRGRLIANFDNRRDFIAFVAAARTPPDTVERWPTLVIA